MDLLPPLAHALLLQVQRVCQARQAVEAHHQGRRGHRSHPRRLPLQVRLCLVSGLGAGGRCTGCLRGEGCGAAHAGQAAIYLHLRCLRRHLLLIPGHGRYRRHQHIGVAHGLQHIDDQLLDGIVDACGEVLHHGHRHPQLHLHQRLHDAVDVAVDLHRDVGAASFLLDGLPVLLLAHAHDARMHRSELAVGPGLGQAGDGRVQLPAGRRGAGPPGIDLGRRHGGALDGLLGSHRHPELCLQPLSRPQHLHRRRFQC
mmetsp:Transcript_12100/g.36295  ORF Transcript_12100/g.36295 Transcript_12100/m.36295 type:complete len:256 (-) Transcript_12100:1788-2555(-)